MSTDRDGADPPQLRRTQLATPASNPDFIESAAETAADEVLLDLEDSVAPEQKPAARETLIEGVEAGDWSGNVLSYRINAIDTRWWYEDIIEVVSAVGEQLDHLVVPKVTSASDVRVVERLLEQVEVNAAARSDVAASDVGPIGLTVQIEDGHGMHNVYDIAHASDRISGVVLGPGDYSASMGAPGLDIGQFPAYPGHYWQHVLSECNAAAKSAGVPCFDGPYADLDDEEGLRTATEHANLLGCDGKWVIHPDQIEVVNDVFAPDRAVAERAERIVDAYADATREGAGAVRIDGQMVDEATHKMAQDVLARAKAADVI